VPSFSLIAYPLYNLLKDATPWAWETAEQSAFDTLRQEMCMVGKALRYFNPKKAIIVHTDWSKPGIGAVLGQVDEDGNNTWWLASAAP